MTGCAESDLDNLASTCYCEGMDVTTTKRLVRLERVLGALGVLVDNGVDASTIVDVLGQLSASLGPAVSEFRTDRHARNGLPKSVADIVEDARPKLLLPASTVTGSGDRWGYGESKDVLHKVTSKGGKQVARCQARIQILAAATPEAEREIDKCSRCLGYDSWEHYARTYAASARRKGDRSGKTKGGGLRPDRAFVWAQGFIGEKLRGKGWVDAPTLAGMLRSAGWDSARWSRLCVNYLKREGLVETRGTGRSYAVRAVDGPLLVHFLGVRLAGGN